MGELVERIPQPAPKEAGVPVPKVSCVSPPLLDGDLLEVDAIAPEDHPRPTQPQDVGWTPGVIADAAIQRDAIAVVDALNRSVTLFTDDFSHRETWGRQGEGPGEFQNPAAVTFYSNGDIAVLDPALRRVTRLSRSGRYRHSFQVDTRAIDLAISSSGDHYVAYEVVPLVDRLSEELRTVVGVFDSNGDELPPLVVHDPKAVSVQRFVLAGPNEVRVRAVGDWVAVFYPAAGTVDLYRQGELHQTIRVCVPQAVDDYYLEQRVAVEQGQRSQAWFRLVTDALPGLPLHTVGPVKDENDRFHIGRFSPAASLVADGGGRDVLEEIRFGESYDRLLAFNRDGVLAVLRYVRGDGDGPL